VRAMMVVGISTLTLVGCDSGAGRSAGKIAVLPTPRAGLWRESVLRDGHGLALIGEVRACLDADARSRLTAVGGRADNKLCQNPAVTRDADGAYHFSSTCDMGPGGRMSTQGILTGNLAQRYRIHSQTDTRGAVLSSMNGRHVTDIEADYLGACPAGMAAGDVIIANGVKVNMNRLSAATETLLGGG